MIQRSEALVAGNVCVWRASIERCGPTAIADLSPDELERAARFQFERDRMRWIASRSFLRRVLGFHLLARARDLRFELEPFGKPKLADPHERLHFSLSHASDVALVAVSLDLEVGVDVERVDPARADEITAERVLTDRELFLWRSREGLERHATFFRAWTAKEAYAKALGHGLSLDPREIDALDDFGEVIAKHSAGGYPLALRELALGPAHAGALAVLGKPEQVVVRPWDG